MKKNKIVEEIALLMQCAAKYVLEEKKIVSEATIISRLSSVKDIESADRDGRTLLINAAFYERTQVVAHLLRLGANVNAKDRNGFTALHAATQTGNLEIATLLLASGADVNAKNAFGNSPVMTCDHRAPLEMFKLLLKYGAAPSQKNNYGVSANECFAAYPHIKVILEQKTD